MKLSGGCLILNKSGRKWRKKLKNERVKKKRWICVKMWKMK